MSARFAPRWTIAQLKEVCFSLTDGDHQAPPRAPTGVPFITISAMNDGTIDLAKASRFVPSSYYDQLAPERQPRAGDILFSVTGSIGIAALVERDVQFVFQRHIAIIRPNASVIDNAYLLHYLRHPGAQEPLREAATGTAQVTIALGTLRSLMVHFPPLAEQRRIVARIEALFARTRRARADLERVAPLARRYQAQARAIAFIADGPFAGITGTSIGGETTDSPPRRFEGLPEIPAHWKWAELESVGYVGGGLTKNQKRNEQPIEIPYLRVANVYADELRLDEIAKIRVSAGEQARARLEPGDLLIVEGNGSVEQIGRVAIWNGSIPNCGHQNHLIRVRPHPAVPPRYLLHWLMSPYGRRALEAVASSSSGLHTLSLSKVAAIPVPVPPITAAKAIVSRLDTGNRGCAEAEHQASRALALLDRLEQSILARAFRGELVAQDPADEPASEMLERLQAPASTKPTRGRRTRGA